jgi:hypothetical protein
LAEVVPVSITLRNIGRRGAAIFGKMFFVRIAERRIPD